jgi:hypothetical protein
VTPWKFSVEGEAGLESDERTGADPKGGPAIEVVAKATRRRFTVEYKRKIVREANACKTSGAVGALLRLRREGLYLLADMRKRGNLNRPAARHDQADVFEGRRVASATRRR